MPSEDEDLRIQEERIRLTADRQKLAAAILAAFPSKGALEQAIFYQLGESLATIGGDGNYREVVTDLIKWAETENRMDELIRGLRKTNTGNLKLREFEEEYNKKHRASSPTQPPAPGPTPQIRTELVQTLLKAPPAYSFEGRSALLIGIPSSSLNRNATNARTDLDMIIDQLESLGQLNSGAWPLLILIDNALSYVTGTAVGRELQKIREKLVEAYGE